ncbi:MAG: DUF2066 domain-containing protein [Gammaproteobacteria bacterium]
MTALYEADVDVENQLAEDRMAAVRTAMRAVLTKVTGDRFASQRTSLLPVIENAEDYLQQYRYTRDTGNNTGNGETPVTGGLTLRVKFDEATLNEALRNLGVPVWGKERPMTLVWVAVQDESGRRLISMEQDPEYIRILDQRARRRGIALIFPLMDLQDTSGLGVSDIWGGFRQPVMEASRRYQADAVLVGKVISSPSDIWEAQWTSYIDGTASSWTTEGSLRDMVMDEGVDGQADLLASRFLGSDTSDRTATISVEVNDITAAGQYARVLDYLRSLSSVTDVQVEQAEAGRVRFAVTAHGGQFAIRQAIALGRLMEPVQDVSGNSYRLLP